MRIWIRSIQLSVCLSLLSSSIAGIELALLRSNMRALFIGEVKRWHITPSSIGSTCGSPSSLGHRGRTIRYTPKCGLQIQIHIRGKRTGGEEWLNEAYLEYQKRLRPVLALETVWHKTDDELEAAVAQCKSPVICLDERGKQWTSQEMATVLYKRLEEGGSRLAFVIGGAEGLPPALKAGQYERWSLSKMTFTHQWARILLTEQIYRATEINKGSGYHKE